MYRKVEIEGIAEFEIDSQRDNRKRVISFITTPRAYLDELVAIEKYFSDNNLPELCGVAELRSFVESVVGRNCTYDTLLTNEIVCRKVPIIIYY